MQWRCAVIVLEGVKVQSAWDKRGGQRVQYTSRKRLMPMLHAVDVGAALADVMPCGGELRATAQTSNCCEYWSIR